MLGFAHNLDFFGWLLCELLHLRFILCIQVPVVLRDIDVNFTARLQIRDLELRCFVVAFSTPRDVMGVAKSINVENIDVSRCEEEVL